MGQYECEFKMAGVTKMTGFHLQSWPSVRKMTIRECCDICETGMLYDARQCDFWCFDDWNDNPLFLAPMP